MQHINGLLLSFGLSMHVTGPSRITQHSRSLLDYVCSNFAPDSVKSDVVCAGISDHETVVSRFSLDLTLPCKCRRRGRLFVKANFLKFQHACSDYDWHLGGYDRLSSFYAVVSDIFNKTFPVVRMRSKRGKPWITKGLRISARNMRSLHYINKFYPNCGQFSALYCSYRRIYKRTIRAAKHLCYQNRLASSDNRQREAWRIVNQLKGGSRSRCAPNANLGSEDFNL